MTEQEVIFLTLITDLIDTMLNFEMLQIVGTLPTRMSFFIRRSISGRFTLPWLTCFLSQTHDWLVVACHISRSLMQSASNRALK